MIVGGGPAGAAAAIVLARAGHDVTLLERNAGPADKVCGDFLSGEAVSVVTRLGVDVSSAARISTVRLIHGRRVATARLPFAALGLSRRMLDEGLLNLAQTHGAHVLRGHAVRGIAQRYDALRVDCGDIGKIDAGTVFLATGKHDMRGLRRPAGSQGLLGLKMYFGLDPHQVAELRSHVELVLFDGGYAGLQLVESERAVLCILLPASRLRAAGGRWDGLLDSLRGQCAHLAARLHNARQLLPRPLAVAGLPYGHVHRPNRGEPSGLFRLGDQAAVIGSLSGDGVALALGSGVLSARTWLRQGTAEHYHWLYARLVRRQMRLASFAHHWCLSAATQRWVVDFCRLFPRALPLAANWTRTETITNPDV